MLVNLKRLNICTNIFKNIQEYLQYITLKAKT